MYRVRYRCNGKYGEVKFSQGKLAWHFYELIFQDLPAVFEYTSDERREVGLNLDLSDLYYLRPARGADTHSPVSGEGADPVIDLTEGHA